jgi:ADP-dependent phosphofructokinase/glucokinase
MNFLQLFEEINISRQEEFIASAQEENTEVPVVDELRTFNGISQII